MWPHHWHSSKCPELLHFPRFGYPVHWSENLKKPVGFFFAQRALQGRHVAEFLKPTHGPMVPPIFIQTQARQLGANFIRIFQGSISLKNLDFYPNFDQGSW
jgi:hypothetical protein